jgi:hypothetical protein
MPRRTPEPAPYLPEEVRAAVVAAQRLAAALAAEGEDLSPSERVVLSRALHHNVEVVGRALAVWLPPEPPPLPAPSPAARVEADADV